MCHIEEKQSNTDCQKVTKGGTIAKRIGHCGWGLSDTCDIWGPNQVESWQVWPLSAVKILAMSRTNSGGLHTTVSRAFSQASSVRCTCRSCSHWCIILNWGALVSFEDGNASLMREVRVRWLKKSPFTTVMTRKASQHKHTLRQMGYNSSWRFPHTHTHTQTSTYSTAHTITHTWFNLKN